jgi:hypothetical protein
MGLETEHRPSDSPYVARVWRGPRSRRGAAVTHLAEPVLAPGYFGKVLRDAKPSARTGRVAALAVYFEFLELRYKVEIYNLIGRVAECPLDEMNRRRAFVDPRLPIVRPGQADRRRA